MVNDKHSTKDVADTSRFVLSKASAVGEEKRTHLAKDPISFANTAIRGKSYDYGLTFVWSRKYIARATL